MVILGNFAGGAAGAAALAWGGVLSDDAAVAATSLALKGLATPFRSLVAKAAFAGLIVAGVVWLVYAVTNSVTRLLVIYLAFLAIPIGNRYHSVVSFTELTYLVLVGEATFLVGMTGFVVPVLLGNTLGGVLLVTVVKYFQTTEERLDIARKDRPPSHPPRVAARAPWRPVVRPRGRTRRGGVTTLAGWSPRPAPPS